MIKPLLLLALAVGGCGSLLTAQDRLPFCETPPTGMTRLQGNAVSAIITNGGDLWFDGDDAGYSVNFPFDSTGFTRSADAAFAGGLWMFGKDPGGGLKGAAQQYGRGAGNFDYGVGPLGDDGLQLEDCGPWNRLWEISRVEVDAFLTNFDPANPEVAAIPINVLGWPGKGNPHFSGGWGFDLPDEDYGYAPFWDENQDGVYDPFDGDYPAFCGDQAVWCIFNDAVLHQESATPVALQMEVHLLAYSFNATDNDPLQRTTFYDYKLINRAQEDLLDFYAGHWVDFDLGCFTDDLVGSLPEHELFYVHNRAVEDTSPCDVNIPDFGATRPVQIGQVLSSSAGNERLMSSFTTYYASGLIDWALPFTAPSTAEGYYNYLTGKWLEGSPITRGNLGYNSGGDTTRYAYDGGLDAAGVPWRICTADFPQPANQLAVYATGPYNLQPKQVATFTFAMTTIFGVDFSDENCPDTAPIIAAAEAVKNTYDASCNPSDLTSTEDRPVTPEGLGLSVFPNPTTESLTFAASNNGTIRTVEIFDALGRLLLQQRGGGTALEMDLRASGLGSGVYFYRLTDATGGLFSGKVILRE